MTVKYRLCRATCIALAALLMGAAGCGRKSEPVIPPAHPAGPPDPEAEVNPAPEPVTMEDFDALLYDMSYVAVRDIVGRESDEVEKEYVKGVGPYDRTELRLWHTWKNPDGSAIKVAFVDDRLLEKVQMNLPGAEENK